MKKYAISYFRSKNYLSTTYIRNNHYSRKTTGTRHGEIRRLEKKHVVKRKRTKKKCPN